MSAAPSSFYVFYETQSTMPDSGAPLFGLRWVPDEQLRPLRYLPAAYLPGQSRVPAQAGGGGGKGGDDDWWRGAAASSSSRAAASASPSPGPAEASFEVGASSASALKLQQSVRVLTQRLSEAQESVRQKSEQIRWLKEMTKDDASRARVARWMRGPLLRVFLAWKRCVREAALAALDDLRGEVSSAKAREHELQAKGDDLSRDHAVLQAALDHFFDAALANRAKARLRVCWRRWAVTRLVIASAAGGWSGTRGEAVHGLTVRRAMAARRALAALRGNARHAGALRTTTLRLQRRLTWRQVRSAFRILKRMQRRADMQARAVGAAPLTIRQRAALARWRREVTRGRRVRSMCRLLLPGSVRRSLRRSWQLWLVEAWRQQRTLCMAEAQRAQRASAELEAKQRLLASAHANAQVAHATASLWSDDELPAMLESLAQAGAAAAAAAATPANALAMGDAVHGAFAIPTGLSGGAGVADAALAALAGRREAAIAASSWQGTQLKLARWCCSSACKCSPRRSTLSPQVRSSSSLWRCSTRSRESSQGNALPSRPPGPRASSMTRWPRRPSRCSSSFGRRGRGCTHAWPNSRRRSCAPSRRSSSVMRSSMRAGAPSTRPPVPSVRPSRRSRSVPSLSCSGSMRDARREGSRWRPCRLG